MPEFDFEEKEFHSEYTTLPMMSLREVVMFPRSIVPLFVGREASVNAIEGSVADFDKHIFLVTQKNAELEVPDNDDLYRVGTVAKILQMLRLPDGTIKVLYEGLYRARWEEAPEGVHEGKTYARATVEAISESVDSSPEAMALIRAIHDSLDSYAKSNKKLPQEAVQAMKALRNPGKLADSIMPHLKVDFVRKQEVLEMENPMKRLERVFEMILGEIEVVELEQRVKGRVKDQMEKNQREYYLNEQLKAINKEMGREDDPQQDAVELEKALDELDMDEDIRERVRKEIKKLRSMSPSSAEYTVLRNYVDCVLDLPWNTVADTSIEIDKSRTILDEDHYGLEKPKRRILEYLAVQSLVESIKGPILCLVGPPGVGKTSIARSVARAMDREFVRLSLGGVRDEAEIRGHRRTYVGALPGKIITALRRVKYNNPVICLDEVDKMSMDFRGDPSAALLEVLDPEQNNAFNDHYLDLDYDLSKVFFITTANTLDSIPLPLQDRMEIIRLPGYLETEKQQIGRDFLLPKQVKQHGLKDTNLQLSDNALLDVVRHYTREAGVRNLERELAAVCRKTAMRIVEGKGEVETVHVTRQNLHSFLGVPRFKHGEAEETAQVGVSTGLAYTQVGGELLVVETALMPGKGKVEVTGKLGDVMKESARAAVSYIRSRSDMFGLKRDFLNGVDIHVHVPEGATPKDGPSAGITLVTSVVSALLNLPVRNDLAMTGEITLRGRVLPIGGLREKLLAAHRGLIKTVLIPDENKKDLKEVPDSIKKDLEIIPVKNMDDVLPHALKCEPDAIFCGVKDVVPLTKLLIKDEYQRPTH